MQNQFMFSAEFHVNDLECAMFGTRGVFTYAFSPGKVVGKLGKRMQLLDSRDHDKLHRKNMT